MKDDLGSLTDELNVAIGNVERNLEERRLGVTAAVPLKLGAGEVGLRFGKENQVWRLTVEYQDGTVTPLVNASREIRCVAMEALPALYSALLAEDTAQRTVVVNAIGIANNFIARLRKP